MASNRARERDSFLGTPCPTANMRASCPHEAASRLQAFEANPVAVAASWGTPIPIRYALPRNLQPSEELPIHARLKRGTASCPSLGIPVPSKYALPSRV